MDDLRFEESAVFRQTTLKDWSESMSQGITGGLTQYGDQGFAKYLRRSFAQSMGYSREMLDRPIVGIANSYSDFNNCHRHFPELVSAVKRGVLAAGGLPLEFPTVSLGEVFLSPTSLYYRNLMSMAVEEMIRGQPMDSVVLLGGCDKTVPAQLMGAISAGKPFIQVVAGPMSTGRYRGERLGACTDCRRYWGKFRAGEISAAEIAQVESNLATTAGTCAVMGTASTMACVAEALGVMLPNSASIPAVHADRLRNAELSGRRAVELAQDPMKLSDVINSDSLENAVRVLMAIGGSTNAVLHLTAIAGRMNLKLPHSDINRISDETPVLVDLKPTGDHYFEDFHFAGGMSALLQELEPLLKVGSRTIAGETLAQRLSRERGTYREELIIRSRATPLKPQGGLVSLSGNLAPKGAIFKRSAADSRLFEKRARAVVFESLEDLSNRIDSPELEVDENSILVLKNAGPTSEAAMPESGYIPIPKKLAQKGIKDMLRLSDARMSGTAYGSVILHVSPDSASGGPLSLVRDGDEIEVSVARKTLSLQVPEAELLKRSNQLNSGSRGPNATAAKSPSAAKSDWGSRGYARLYRNHVTQADQGCDFDFLMGQ